MKTDNAVWHCLHCPTKIYGTGVKESKEELQAMIDDHLKSHNITQQSTVEERWEKEFFEKFGANKIWVSPSRDNVETIHDIYFFIKSEIQLAEQKTMEELMKKLYSSIQDDYIECTIDYFLKDQAEILGININN